eukprot:s1186_g8.t1
MAGISVEEFVFGMKRNDFTERYHALAANTSQTGPPKKKGRKEIKLSELPAQQQHLFTEVDGSDDREWKAWQNKQACDVLSLEESLRIRREKPDLIVPTRWVRTNKHDGLVGKEFLAKSRLVVQGFKDKSLGQYRRDAPTASAVAEAITLAVCAYHHFVLFAKDIKNAYFSGKSITREVYLDPPRGGLRGVQPGQLLRARKAIYGFAEVARLFWLALKEQLESDGWQESKLEPALFYLRRKGQLKGILVTHVDDLEGGVSPDLQQSAFEKSSQALEFATNHFGSFIFRGREIRQTNEGHIDVSMRNYSLSLKNVKMDRERKKQLEDDLRPDEVEQLNSSAGELGWLARQLRCDLAYENGVAQKSKQEPIVADLLRLRQYISAAKRGADFKMRYWSDVNLKDGAILQGETVRCNILCYHSGQTKRVCRSTLAAEASHLAEAVEAGDWITVLLEEALTGQLDLRNWSDLVERRQRVYVTDARSVYDYLQKDATSTSTDKRMAIEGALLRETCRKPGSHVKWIDGLQNIANVLTKHGAEKDTLRAFLRDGMMSLQQTEQNKRLKEKQREDRQKRAQVKRDDTALKELKKQERRKAVLAEVRDGSSSEAPGKEKDNECEGSP